MAAEAERPQISEYKRKQLAAEERRRQHEEATRKRREEEFDRLMKMDVEDIVSSLSQVHDVDLIADGDRLLMTLPTERGHELGGALVRVLHAREEEIADWLLFQADARRRYEEKYPERS